MNESSHIFADLQPPPGGLQRLQRTLRSRHDSRHSSHWQFVAGAVAVSVLALAWLLPGVIARHQQTVGLLSAMRAAMTPTSPASGIQVIDGAAIELPSGQPDVRLYLVQSDAPLAQAHLH